MTRALFVLVTLTLAPSCSKKKEPTVDPTPPTPPRPPVTERLAALSKVADFPVPTGTVGWAFAVSADGTEYAVGNSDGSITLMSRAGGDTRVLVGHKEPVFEAAYTPDGQRLVTGARDNRLLVFDLEKGEVEHDIKAHNGDVKALAVSPDGTMAASGSVADDVRVWRLADGKRQAHFAGHSSTVYAVAWSADGKHVFSGARDSQVRRWSLETGKEDGRPLVFRSTVIGLEFSPDHGTLWVLGLTGGLAGVDPKTFEVKHSRQTSRGRATDLDVGSDGTIAIGHLDGTISFWSPDETKTEPLVPPFQAHDGEARQVRFLPETAGLLSVGEDGTVGLWETTSGQPIGPRKKLPPINGVVRALAAEPGGTTIAATGDGHLFLYDASRPTVAPKRPDLGPGGVSALCWSADGKALYVGRDNGHLLVLPSPLTGADHPSHEIHRGTVRHIGGTADGKLLVTAGDDIAIQVLSTDTFAPKRTITDHTSPIVSLAVDPTGERMASTEENHITLVRYLDNENVQWTRRGHLISHLAFSPDGTTLAMVEDRRVIVLYDVVEDGGGREVKRLKGNPSPIQGLKWHPSGEVVVVIDKLGTVRTWDVETGAMINSGDAGRGRPTAVAIAREGSLVVTGGMDPHGSIKAFSLGPK